MRVTITFGTLFTPTPDTAQYEESSRCVLEVTDSMTVGELSARVDGVSPPHHGNSSYLSLPHPHEALPELVTLRDRNQRRSSAQEILPRPLTTWLFSNRPSSRI
jgi:hypothetical protein